MQHSPNLREIGSHFNNPNKYDISKVATTKRFTKYPFARLSTLKGFPE